MENTQVSSIVVAALVAVLAFVAGWWLRHRNAAAQLQATRDAQDSELRAVRSQMDAERIRADTQFAEAARVPDAIARAERAEMLAAQLNDTVLQLKSATATELATASAQRDAALAAGEDAKAFLKEAQERLRVAFTDAASKVFDDKSRALDAQIKDSGALSRQNLEATLKPFAQRVDVLQTKIESLASEEAKERATLVGALGELKTLNQDMADATNSLTRALRSNSKVRGQWGELILETVLKASGLVEGMNFVSQTKSVDDDSGQRRFADVVVKLPDGREVVIDSKVNLVAWAEATEAETPEQQRDAMTRHAGAMRLHMRDLSEKNYPRAIGPHALDMTVMFVPIEGALSGALSVNADLQIEAFDKRVVFASPNTLMAMLQVISRLWTRDRLQKQLNTIGSEAGKLIDAITALLEEFDAIGTHINRTDAAFKQARNRLTESSQSVLARAKRLVEAGAKGKKALPEELRPTSGESGLDLLDSDSE